MPYRHAGDGFCAHCNAFALERCPRCGLALCREHAPRVALLCRDCEEEYAQLSQMMRSVPLFLSVGRVALAVALCLLVVLVGQLEAFVQIGPVLSVAGVLMSAIFGASLWVICRHRLGLRQRFLSEGKPRPKRGILLPMKPTALLFVRW